jgi:TPP-dependent indolepyruvate ferredoxin oxidoreductase alpha subunit
VKLPCPLEATEVAVAELLVAEEIVVVELLSQYEETAVAELLVDEEEWQVHGPHVTTSVFDLTVYIASMGISTHLRKFHAGSTI